MTKTATIKNLKAVLFYSGAVAMCVPPLFVFAWMIMTGLKTGVQNISYPPEFKATRAVTPSSRQTALPERRTPCTRKTAMRRSP